MLRSQQLLSVFSGAASSSRPLVFLAATEKDADWLRSAQCPAESSFTEAWQVNACEVSHSKRKKKKTSAAAAWQRQPAQSYAIPLPIVGNGEKRKSKSLPRNSQCWVDAPLPTLPTISVSSPAPWDACGRSPLPCTVIDKVLARVARIPPRRTLLVTVGGQSADTSSHPWISCDTKGEGCGEYQRRGMT